jgi:mycothiol synthase
MTSADPVIDERSRLSPEEVSAVLRLVDEVTAADGVRPLSEHVMLHLRYGGEAAARSLLARRDSALVGYAHLDTTDVVAGPSLELAVAPAARRHGYGRALVGAAARHDPDGRLRLWAHGRQSGAGELARGLGFVRERVLWQMRRSLSAPLPPVTLPPGVRVRTFVVGQDEPAWLDVNNRAFAHHPEQGRWSLQDVRTREREAWFDPAGFFLAEVAEPAVRTVGFHWTKVHGANSDAGHGHQAIGEVYVVGVDPAFQGHGLGRALTLVGLHHLRDRGVSEAMLYVDESNTAAIRVYERLGFTLWDVDVQYRRP